MKIKFDTFLNEARMERFDINFSADNKRLIIESGEKMTDILKKNLVGRLVNFHTDNFIKDNFKTYMSTHHDAIMNIEDVLFNYDAKSPYCSPFLVKSHDRKYTVYYDISPSGNFFYIDSFLEHGE